MLSCTSFGDILSFFFRCFLGASLVPLHAPYIILAWISQAHIRYLSCVLLTRVLSVHEYDLRILEVFSIVFLSSSIYRYFDFILIALYSMSLFLTGQVCQTPTIIYIHTYYHLSLLPYLSFLKMKIGPWSYDFKYGQGLQYRNALCEEFR